MRHGFPGDRGPAGGVARQGYPPDGQVHPAGPADSGGGGPAPPDSGKAGG